MRCRRKWQPSPMFLPGESQGLRSLVGCHLWGRTELDTTSDLAAAAAPTGYCCSSGLPTSDLTSGSFSWQVLPNWIVGLINSVVKVPFVKTGLWSYVWEVAFEELGVQQNCFQCFSLWCNCCCLKPLWLVLKNGFIWALYLYLPPSLFWQTISLSPPLYLFLKNV